MTDNSNCIVTVPKNALTPLGLSTPWIVSVCDQATIPTFAECTIVDQQTGQLSVYSPLLVNQKDRARVIKPPVPVIPKNAVVGCWFGTNGATTTLKDTDHGATLKKLNCVNGGPDGSIFGQFAACNAEAFFSVANRVANVPPLGVGKNGLPCYTTRSFQLVDMDQSDNVVTKYLMTPKRVFAQATRANQQRLGAQAQELTNGSDNLLLDALYRPAIGCLPFTTRNLADPTGAQVGSLALNELQAARYQIKNAALVPSSDPMVLVNGKPNAPKQNAYRSSVNQPKASLPPDQQAFNYCIGLIAITAPTLISDMRFTMGQPTPDSAAAKDLFTFLGQRFASSWTGLTCDKILANRLLGADNKPASIPVTPNTDDKGVCVSLTFNTAYLVRLLSRFGGANQEAKFSATALQQYIAPPQRNNAQFERNAIVPGAAGAVSEQTDGFGNGVGFVDSVGGMPMVNMTNLATLPNDAVSDVPVIAGELALLVESGMLGHGITGISLGLLLIFLV
ncbi:hypothetical protein HDU81_010452 [Chytriomyces hyalinus]|nr:hypothetical protein HDU81_010452 [Chytriomyces hyalinus]